jgi:hypothetical protein
MKLHQEKNEIESDVLTEETFGIADTGFIISLLRDKIYSNKIRAVVQEYICNARDAQRANGTNRKFVVSNPTALDPNWRCRDFGDSITPENMVNVFIRYGASTKRESDEFTGGFGIGCKTGFSYGAGTFSVITYLNGIKRSYNCFIDDSCRGKLALLEEISTDEPNGLEIVVPVEKRDFYEFVRETFRAIRFWPEHEQPETCERVRHLIENKPANKFYEGTDYFISNYEGHCLNVLVDGICYPIPLENRSVTGNYADELSIVGLLSYGNGIYVNYPIGTLPINANRESIELTVEVKKLLQEKFKQIGKEVAARVNSEITGANSYEEACEKCKEFSVFLAIGYHNFYWKGSQLCGSELSVGKYGSTTRVYLVPNGKGKMTVKRDNPQKSYYRIDKSVSRVVIPYEKKDGLSPKAVNLALLKVMEDNNLNCVDFIVNNYDNQLKHFVSYNFFDYYTEPKESKPKEYKNDYIFNIMSFNDKNWSSLKKTSLKDYKEAPTGTKKIWGIIAKDHYNSSLPENKIGVSLYRKIRTPAQVAGAIASIAKINGVKQESFCFYGVYSDVPREQILATFKDAIYIGDYLDDFFKSQGTTVDEVAYEFDFDFHRIKKDELNKICDLYPNTIVSEFWISVHKRNKIIWLNETFGSLLSKGNISPENLLILEKSNQNLRALYDKMLQRYPLLRNVNTQPKEFTENEIVDYINMLEEKYEKLSMYQLSGISYADMETTDEKEQDEWTTAAALLSV